MADAYICQLCGHEIESDELHMFDGGLYHGCCAQQRVGHAKLRAALEHIANDPFSDPRANAEFARRALEES